MRPGSPTVRLGILGAGSWGTALAIHAARLGHQIQLWVHGEDTYTLLQEHGENRLYLPGISIPENVSAVRSLEESVVDIDALISVIPSEWVREIFTALHGLIPPNLPIISATKGIENDSLLRMTQVIEQVLGKEKRPSCLVLSGPSFANEVAIGYPTAVVLAGEDEEQTAHFQRLLSSDTFRIYRGGDIIGVETAGALKNVIAIAAGVIDGVGLGYSSRAALITRGLREISRLATQLGGKAETVSGLAGLGDLTLTCTSDMSRNQTVGRQLGQGKGLREILDSMKMVAEGVRTTRSAYDLALRESVEMPITEKVYALLYGRALPEDAIRELMVRKLKRE